MFSNFILRPLIALLFVPLVFALTVNAAHANDLMKDAVQAYKLGAGDQVKVTVFGEPELSGTYTISEVGSIAMPLIGGLTIDGRSVPEAQSLIANAYQEGFLVNPSVSVELQSRRPFYILGEVRKPGSYMYVDNITVLQAVALAGGFTYRARQSHMTLKTPGGQENKIQPETNIMPGDVVVVNERFF